MCQLILRDNKKWYSFIGQLLSAVFCHIRAGVSSSLDTYVHVPQTVQFIFNNNVVSALLALNTILIINTKREKRSIPRHIFQASGNVPRKLHLLFFKCYGMQHFDEEYTIRSSFTAACASLTAPLQRSWHQPCT